MVDFKNFINCPDYNFLRENKHLGNKIIFLTYGGSHAYGTNVESSDIDIRGCALNSRSELLQMAGFEQVLDTHTDTTIYSFKKLIDLITSCNPNTIEMLGCKREHYFIMTQIGQELLENRKMFLSQLAVQSFSGYANQQLRRLENALARDTYPQAEKERHILGSCMSAMMDFKNRYEEFAQGSIKLHIENSDHEDLESEIFVDVNLINYPLRDYKNIWADLNNIIKDYSKLNKRNRKKDEVHLNKHAMHLVRLYLMCLDILEKEEIVTYREHDRELLMSIRGGVYQKDDGTYRQEFFEMIDDLEKRVDYAAKNTGLPEQPNYNKIEEFVLSVNERVITNAY